VKTTDTGKQVNKCKFSHNITKVCLSC
jgi:hypothetical protein